MKKILLNSALLLISFRLFSQGLTANGEGQSSLLFKGSNISLDLGKTTLGIEVNNLNKIVGKKNKELWGVSASGENTEGIGDLFSSGNIQPSSSANGFFGWSFSNGYVPQVEARKQVVTNKLVKAEKKFLKNFYEAMPSFIMVNTQQAAQKNLQITLLGALRKQSAVQDFKALLADTGTAEEKAAKKLILTEVERLESQFIKESKALDVEWQKIIESEDAKKDYCQFMVYAMAGINAVSFKHYEFNSENLKESFVNQDFHGGNAGIGINFQAGSLIIGANYLYDYSHNFKLLTKKEYVFKDVKTQTPPGTQSITEEKKINAYVGAYDNVEINTLKFDIAYNLKLDEDANNHVLINPYYRSTTFSNKSKLLPYTMDAGLGLYFFNANAKFLGGIYAELPDIQDNIEKLKPEEDQNLKSPFKRGSFGIVTKFSISSLLNLF